MIGRRRTIGGQAHAASNVAVDHSGNGNNGTYIGGYTKGQTGIGDGQTSVLLDGSSGYVSLPSVAQLEIIGNTSLVLAVNFTSFPTYEFLIAKDSGNTPAPYEWRAEPSGQMQWLAADPAHNSSDGPSVKSLGSWGLYTVSCAATVSTAAPATFYVDSTKTVGGSSVNGVADNGDPILIGTRGDFFSFMPAYVAKAAIFDYILSDSQVAAFAAALSSGTFDSTVLAASPVGYWPLND